MTKHPDVVIPVRHGDQNEELRYALRSIAAFLPHRHVWIVGHRPSWVTNAYGIHLPQNGTKHQNSLSNLLAACRDEAVSEEFVLWNDDFFLLEPLPAGVPALHRGPARDFLATYAGRRRSQYVMGLEATIEILEKLGHLDPLSYELHVPMPMTKSGVLTAHKMATAGGMPETLALQIRTLSGNLFPCRLPKRAEDVKIFVPGQPWAPGQSPFVSTMDGTWNRHPAGKYVRRLLRELGPYERTT